MLADFSDLSWGKFSDPMARFIYERVLLTGDFGDDEYSDGDGTWGSRYGRRILEGDSLGFVYHTKFDTVAEATELFRKVAATIETDTHTLEIVSSYEETDDELRAFIRCSCGTESDYWVHPSDGSR